MYICYIDESGGFEAPDTAPDATPLMALAGLIISADVLHPLTADFLDIKRRFFPGAMTGRLDDVLVEIKGLDLRRALRASTRRERRHAIGFLDGVVGLIEEYDLRLIGRIWIKASAEALEPRSSYAYATQDIARHFSNFLEQYRDSGLLLCDGREHHQDAQVAHSIFTMKHRRRGDRLPHLIEVATFGRSVNHVGLQLADIVVSGLLFPMAARVYCAGRASGVHTHRSFDELRRRYAGRLRSRQHLYSDGSARTRGGIVVSDKLSRQSSTCLFELPVQAQ